MRIVSRSECKVRSAFKEMHICRLSNPVVQLQVMVFPFLLHPVETYIDLILISYRLSKCAPIIAATGFSFLVIGSGSTLKPSNAIAPRRNSESFGPNITREGNVSAGSNSVMSADPSKRRSRRPSANVTSLVCKGAISIASNRSSGIKVYNEPVSTQKSSSKKSCGFDGLETFTCTLNIPIVIALSNILTEINVTKILGKINDGRKYEGALRREQSVERYALSSLPYANNY